MIAEKDLSGEVDKEDVKSHEESQHHGKHLDLMQLENDGGRQRHKSSKIYTFAETTNSSDHKNISRVLEHNHQIGVPDLAAHHITASSGEYGKPKGKFVYFI